MFIYQVQLNVLDTYAKTEVLAMLPNTTITIGYQKQLPEVLVAMAVHTALAQLSKNNHPIDLGNQDHMHIYNTVTAFIDLVNLPQYAELAVNVIGAPLKFEYLDVIQFSECVMVNQRGEWHVDLNMMDIITWAHLVKNDEPEEDEEDISLPDGEFMYFDVSIPSFYHTHDSFDPYASLKLDGFVEYNQNTDAFSIVVSNTYKDVAVIFEDDAVIEYFKKRTKAFIQRPDYQSACGCEIKV